MPLIARVGRVAAGALAKTVIIPSTPPSQSLLVLGSVFASTKHALEALHLLRVDLSGLVLE